MIQQQVQQVAVGKGDLIAYDEGLAPWSWGSRVSKGFRHPGNSFTKSSLSTVGVDEGGRFVAEVLQPSFTTPSGLPPTEGEGQAAQDGTKPVQGEVSVVKLGELLVQTGSLERALQPGLLGHHFLLPALALVS